MRIQFPVKEELDEIEAQLSFLLFKSEARFHYEALRIVVSLCEIKDVHTEALLDVILGLDAEGGHVFSLLLRWS